METTIPSLEVMESVPPRTSFQINSNLPKNCHTIHAIVEAQARLRPNEIALVSGGESLTYRELDQQAAKLAQVLIGNGVQLETIVGVYMERSIRTVIAILGILKAGGTYLPIDLAYPEERVNYILKDSQAIGLITESAHLSKLAGFQGKKWCLDENLALIEKESTASTRVEVSGSNSAYIIYTSGSTGKPKGVIVTHHNVVRLFAATDHWYGFNHRDVWTVFHSFAFDFSVWELWGALFYGGKAVIVPYLLARSPEAFYNLLHEQKVTVLNQTPSAFRQLIWAENNSSYNPSTLSLRYVIFGGEALELQSLKPWFERHAPDRPQLVNMYGITETTVHVTYRPITPDDLAAGLGSVIGQPIPDLSLHLLDENQNPVAPGEPGEICVGGEGVARGYLNRPDLTRERFIAHPFSDDPEARLYRSGDLARALPNGDYEYLGRIDHQVKIHGFRIELGEIESVLNSHELIRESVVVVDEQAGEKRLIGYIVPSGKAPDISQLREFVSKRLPQYMVPARFMVLDKLPLTINGKVDRRALPSISQERPELRTEYIPPTTNNELTLAAIWESVLGIGKVGINDNFFELGGDSIRSIQVLAKAQENGIRFSLQKLFQHPTVSGLLQNLDDKVDDEIDLNPTPFARVSKLDQAKMPSDVIDAFPIGRLQNGMIYHSDLDLESAIFHDVFSFRLNLPYNEKVLKNAIARLADRHAIYRTSFHPNDFSEPLQLVHRSAQVPFSVEDLRNETEAEQRAKLIQWVEVEKRNRFDWSKAPLMRLHVQLYSENAFQFIVSFHHVIMDGWSLAMMLTELFQDYMALLENKESNITSPKVTYRDFVQLEERTSHSPVSQDYWKSKLEGAQVHTLPRWPHKPERHGHEQVRGPEIYYPESLLAKLREIAKSTGVPIRTVLLAAHCRVMNLLTGQSDIMTGLVANGRPQTPDGERLIGLFLNTLPFRLQVEGTWRGLIQQTFKGEQELIPHRRMPLADIQQMTGGNPLFETTFDFVQFHIYRDLPGYKDHTFLEDHYFEANNFNFFVTFMLDASARELQMHFDYNPNEFSKEQIKAICDYYTQTLNAIAANPDESCKGLSLIPQPELGLIESWNQTETVIPAWTVPEKVSKIAANTPDKIACVFKDKEWTYAQLEDHANLIAAHISEQGLGANDFVGIYLNRSLEMVAAALGVLKAGAAYIPLDPNYPAERLGFMIKDSGLKLILTDSATSPKFHENHSVQYLSIDKLGDKLSKSENIGYSAENLAYVIYTSGSTGTPKGVQIPHGALTNFLASMQTQPGISADDRLLAVTTLSFDIAGLELWLPLVTGSTVVIADSEDAKDPAALSRLIEEQEITVLQATPVTWNALVESGWQGKSDLKALCGGESLNPALAQELVSRCGELWNMYGPTETTIWSTIEKVERDQLVTIGRPIANTEISILDADLHPVPVGSPGEIYIGGAGLAKGYLNRAELTREKFIPHPFRQNERLYRTGDLGRFLPDGRILCLGRTDNQVKIRGFRIELGEIEAALEEHDSVCKAVVSIREDESGINELLAYWQPVENSTTSAAELRKYLQDRLPNHMVPSAWMEVKEFVLTPSGKIDRKKLPAFVAAEQVASNDAVPETPFELEVADTWRSVLKVPEIGLHDDFFEVGGHSLAAMRIVGNLRSKYNVDITLARFFQQPTVQALAAQVENLVKSHYNSQEQNGASKIVDI